MKKKLSKSIVFPKRQKVETKSAFLFSSSAVRKAVSYAKKHMIIVPMKGSTIPHEVFVKRGAAQILIKPAPPGTGVIAGGAVRAVVDAAGIHDIVSKILGSKNQASNVYATIEALKKFKVKQQG